MNRDTGDRADSRTARLLTKPIAGSGNVRIHGEIWGARSGKELKSGDLVRVVRREGLTLFVEPE
jgi:membrane protein implicated in regulation of membrane protease activity